MKLLTPDRGAIDQITSALDPKWLPRCSPSSRELAADGMTLLLVTHAMRFAQPRRLVHESCIHEIGPPGKVFASPNTPERRHFFGLN